jgi:ribonuclease VapC
MTIPVNWLEVVIRLDRKGDTVALSRFDELERLLDIEVVPTTFAHARLARIAYRRFGKGSGHPAQLNLADCMAYALAKESGQPLLFKGGDFSHTDIEPALKR